VVGVYPSSVAGEVAHILTSGRVRVVVAEDQEQVDKLVDLWRRGEISAVKAVVFYDPHGLEHYDLPGLQEFTAVETQGRDYERSAPGWLDQQVALGRASDVAVICTTSGTTGRPKLAMLSHRNMLSMARSLLAVDPIGPGDRFVSFLPLAWIGEQFMALGCALEVGLTLSFPEDASTVRSDLREIGPSTMFSPPRIWEDMVSSVQVRVGEADWAKRAVFTWAHGVGDAYAGVLARGERPGMGLRLRRRVADWVGLRPVRDRLGLSRLRRAYTGGAPLGPDVCRFFHALGVNLKQVYGQTEIGGLAVGHRDDDVHVVTVGVPFPGTELRIAQDGEVLLRSPAVFCGYYGDAEATRRAVDAEGWLHTGDAGHLDGGHLVVIDRAKDVMKTPDGTAFSPAYVESKLKFSPYIDEAVVFGGDRPYIAALITIDPNTTGPWAEARHLSYPTYASLAQSPEVYELIAGEVAHANQDVPESTRVRRFALLHKQLDADDEEVTRTRKVRRAVINDRYATIVGALYGDSPSVTVISTVTYQDGTIVEREISLRLHSLDGLVPAAQRSRNPAMSARR
jgi:long-chain acyl-CoA synthetase